VPACLLDSTAQRSMQQFTEKASLWGPERAMLTTPRVDMTMLGYRNRPPSGRISVVLSSAISSTCMQSDLGLKACAWCVRAALSSFSEGVNLNAPQMCNDLHMTAI
jgi:hypothetical protein